MPESKRRIIITGGAGFIGSALVRHLLESSSCKILVVDNLSRGENLKSLKAALASDRFRLERIDICDRAALGQLLFEFAPDVLMHLAAETHVDHSISDPTRFVRSNIDGTFVVLDSALGFWRALPKKARKSFRFLHVSTDEVFGELGDEGLFSEQSAYDPRSPYSASKAGSDHLARAWYHTYGLPVVITNCTNNYGPFQFPEKLIPFMIAKCLSGQNLPIYGTGHNIRDWIHVDDHVRALVTVFERGTVGETYLVGARCERTNLQVVQTICDVMDGLRPRSDGLSHREQITFVPDRPGHDFRYAIDPSKIENELGWRPREDFEAAMEKTIRWYIENEAWLRTAQPGRNRT